MIAELDQSMMVRDALAKVVAARLVANRSTERCALHPTDWQNLLFEVINWPSQFVACEPSQGPTGQARSDSPHSLFIVFCGRRIEFLSDPGTTRQGTARFYEVPR